MAPSSNSSTDPLLIAYNKLLARYDSLQPALSSAPASLLVDLHSFAEQLRLLISSRSEPQRAFPTQLPDLVVRLFSYRPPYSNSQVQLLWDSVKLLIEWIVVHELAPPVPDGGDDPVAVARNLVQATERREAWGAWLLKLFESIKEHLEHTEELTPAGSGAKDQPYRTLIASALIPTLVKFVSHLGDLGWSDDVLRRVPDLCRYAALDVYSDSLSKNQPNKKLTRQVLPPSTMAVVLRQSTDFHISSMVMEIAFRAVPAFTRSEPARDNPKWQFVRDLFPPSVFASEAKEFQKMFYDLTGTSYYSDMPEILKRMAYHNIERNQPFIAHSLTFNGRKLVTPDSEVEIWICRDAILGTVQVLADSGDEFEERMHVALEDVKGMEVVDSPEGHDGYLIVKLSLKHPPHVGAARLSDPPGAQGHVMVLETTNKGNALRDLTATMEDRARHYHKLNPQPTSSGTSTSSRPSLMRPPPPQFFPAGPAAPPVAVNRSGSNASSYRKSSQAGPVIGQYREPSPPPPPMPAVEESEDSPGNLETPAIDSQTAKRGQELATMAQIEDDDSSDGGTKRDEASVGDQAEDSLEKELDKSPSRSKSREKIKPAGKESSSESPLAGRLEVDVGELSSDLSEIEEDEEKEVKVVTRQPSKATSSRKSTSTKPTSKPKAVIVHAPPAPKRRSPRLSQQGDREVTESIDEESTETKMQTQAKAFLKGRGRKAKSSEPDEIQVDSVPTPRARKATPVKQSLTSPASKSAGSSIKRRAPHLASAIAIAKQSVAEEAQEAQVVPPKEGPVGPLPVPIPSKRPRSPSPASTLRPRTKMTIVDAPAYPKRRKVTDLSPMDSQAPYQTTLEPEKQPTAKTTLEEKKVKPVSKKKYGKEKKERKVAESKPGKGNGKRKEARAASEAGSEPESDEEVQQEDEVVDAGNHEERAADETDFDALPHAQSKSKRKVIDRMQPAGKTQAAKSKATADSVSTARSTRSGRSAPKPKEVKAKPVRKPVAKKQSAAEKVSPQPVEVEVEVKRSAKKNETFSQLVATTAESNAPAERPTSPAHLDVREPEKGDVDFGPPDEGGIGFMFSPEMRQPTADKTAAQPDIAVPRSSGSPPLDPALDQAFVDKVMGEHKDDVATREAPAQQIEAPQADDMSVDEEHSAAVAEQQEEDLHCAQDEVDEEPTENHSAPVADEEQAGQQQAESGVVEHFEVVEQARVEEEADVERDASPLHLGDHLLGPTPVQPRGIPQEPLLSEPETEQSAQDPIREDEEDEEDVGDGEEEHFDQRRVEEEEILAGIGEDSGYFPAEHEKQEREEPEQPSAPFLNAKKKYTKARSSVPKELVPATSSQPQPSFEHQPRLQVRPTVHVSPRFVLQKPVTTRAAKPKSTASRLSFLAKQSVPAQVFSSPHGVPKKRFKAPPRRRASSEPPSLGRAEPSPRPRSKARHSESDVTRNKEQHDRKGREQSIYETVDQLEEDERLRQQLGEIVNYIVLKARARRISQAQGLSESKGRIEKQLLKSAQAMHLHTLAIVEGAAEQVEQVKSASAKLAELRERSRQTTEAAKEALGIQ